MHRYQVFYSEQPEGRAGIEPVMAMDAFEACQEMERKHPGAVLASVDGELTEDLTIRSMK